MASVDYQRVPVTYQEGRSVLARPEEWGQLVELPSARCARVLDVGAGTGIFTRAWPAWGASCVVGLDPSLAMLAEARRSGLPPEAVLVVGKAECLPFAAQSFDAAWMSMVFHHVTDRQACARELARVLAPPGRQYVRGFFAGTSQLDWLPYFPGHERALARFPSVDDVAAVFSGAGFSVLRLDEVREPPRSIEFARAWITKMRHADTLLTALTDDEVAIGLAAIDAAGTTELGGSLHLLTLVAPE